MMYAAELSDFILITQGLTNILEYAFIITRLNEWCSCVQYHYKQKTSAGS